MSSHLAPVTIPHRAGAAAAVAVAVVDAVAVAVAAFFRHEVWGLGLLRELREDDIYTKYRVQFHESFPFIDFFYR